MTKNIKFRISFINHLNENINLNNFLINVEAGSLLYEINKGYINLDFVTNGVYYDPSIIGDNIERVKVKWQIDDNEIQEELFCVEAVDYLKDNNIKVYCRSKSFKYEKYYLNKIVTGESLIEILSNIFDGNDVALDFTELTDLKFTGTLNIENKSGFDVVDELRAVYRFEYYYRQGTIYFCDKKAIDENDKAVAKFNEITDIESFNTSTDLFKKRIKEIKFNPIKEQDIKKEITAQNAPTVLKMQIEPSPQPCRPDETLTYTDDDGNTYKIAPQTAQFTIYYSPFAGFETPKVNMPVDYKSKTLVEKYELNDEDELFLTAHIEWINKVEGVDSYYAEKGTNYIKFDKKYTGEVKISYNTDVIVGTIPNSPVTKEIPIKVTWRDREINFKHKIVLNGYYPVPYDLTLNTISDWGLDADSSINKTIKVAKFDNNSKSFISQNDVTSDAFGDFTIHLESYGTYRFELSGADDLFLDYFVNKKEIYMTKKACQ